MPFGENIPAERGREGGTKAPPDHRTFPFRADAIRPRESRGVLDVRETRRKEYGARRPKRKESIASRLERSSEVLMAASFRT